MHHICSSMCWSQTLLIFFIYKVLTVLFTKFKYVQVCVESMQGLLGLYVHLALQCMDFGPQLHRFPTEQLSKIHRYFITVSQDLHACFSTFLYYLREFGYDLSNSFELYRAYKFYKFKGGWYDLKKAGKPLHVQSNYPVNFK